MDDDEADSPSRSRPLSPLSLRRGERGPRFEQAKRPLVSLGRHRVRFDRVSVGAKSDQILPATIDDSPHSSFGENPKIRRIVVHLVRIHEGRARNLREVDGPVVGVPRNARVQQATRRDARELLEHVIRILEMIENASSTMSEYWSRGIRD